MHKKFLAAIFLISLILPSGFSFGQETAEDTKTLKSFVSFDLGFIVSSLRNNGLGIGVTYEKLISPYVSLTSGFSNGLMQITDEDMYCLLVGLSLGANYYPFGKGLEKFYIGTSFSTDFQNYTGDVTIDKNDDAVTSITPKIGWKNYYLKRRLMLDFFTGYKFIVFNSNNYARNKDYITHGFTAGIKFKIL